MVEAAKKKVAFVTAGDTMAATTHVDLRIRAMEEGIPTNVIHGVSIFTACASALGLQPYKFGRTVTMPFPEPGYHPALPVREHLRELVPGTAHAGPAGHQGGGGRYMTANQAVHWLLEAEKARGRGWSPTSTIICAAARVGSRTEKVAAGYPDKMLKEDMGPPLHAVVVPGKLHFMEAYALVKLAGAPEEIADDQNL